MVGSNASGVGRDIQEGFGSVVVGVLLLRQKLKLFESQLKLGLDEGGKMLLGLGGGGRRLVFAATDLTLLVG